MARPIKKGLVFFYNDVDFYQDIRIRKLIRRKGGQAATVYHILLCEIYRQGYYLPWDDDIPFLVLEVSGFEEDYIKDVIDFCIEVGLFDKQLFEREKVLTSSGIQHRYFAAGKDAKRKVGNDLPYLLVTVENEPKKSVNVSEPSLDFGEDTIVSSEETLVNSEETHDNSEEKPINSENSTQRKEKKRIGKHSSSADIRAREGETVLAAVDDESRVFSSVDDEITQLRASPIWKEQVFMRFKFLQCSEQVLFDFLDRWGVEVKIAGKQHQNLGDAKHHFCNWMIIQEDKFNKNKISYGTDNNNGYRTNDDILQGGANIIRELRSEGSKPKRELPVV